MAKRKPQATSKKKSTPIKAPRKTDYSDLVNKLKNELTGSTLEEIAAVRRVAQDKMAAAEEAKKSAATVDEGAQAAMLDRFDQEGITDFTDKEGNKWTEKSKLIASVTLENLAAFKARSNKEGLEYLWSAKPNSKSLAAYAIGLLEEGKNPPPEISIWEKPTIRRRKP